MRVTANERRRAILETLCRRRRDTRENLAFEFGEVMLPFCTQRFKVREMLFI